jgi:hypothetical protein
VHSVTNVASCLLILLVVPAVRHLPAHWRVQCVGRNAPTAVQHKYRAACEEWEECDPGDCTGKV